jgi:hypothetical protein
VVILYTVLSAPMLLVVLAGQAYLLRKHVSRTVLYTLPVAAISASILGFFLSTLMGGSEPGAGCRFFLMLTPAGWAGEAIK